MKKFLVSIMIAVTALSMVAEVGARPLGGGRSIGRQSPAVARQAPAPAAAPAPQRAAAAPAPAPVAPAAVPARPSMWKGMLGGALLGLGLGALFSHFGMGGAMAGALGTILMLALLALAVMFVIRMFRRNPAPANAAYSAYSNVTPLPAGGAPDIGAKLRGASAPDFGAPAAAAVAAPAAPWGVPADFDTANFLRHAKASFIHMQAAWDKADVNDLREFTTPEVYAELKLQIQERGNVGDFTDVVSIEGELLGIETTASDYLASVRFTGMIRSAPTAPAEPFAEVWNMAKPLSGASGWVLAGIQQLPA